jgi:hypothetical protein
MFHPGKPLFLCGKNKPGFKNLPMMNGIIRLHFLKGNYTFET